MSERRVGLVQRLKVAEKEVDSLRGKRDEAADYLERQGRMLRLKLVEPTCYVEQTQVGAFLSLSKHFDGTLRSGH